MKSIEIKTIEDSIRNHIVDALRWFYKQASVGNNPFMLIKKRQIGYSDGMDYTITGIEVMFSKEYPNGMVEFHQVEDGTTYKAHYPVTTLATDKMLELLEAFEIQTGAHYPAILKV